MLRKIRADKPEAAAVRLIYGAMVERSRAPVFYRELGVADTIDGRFDLLALHAFVVMEALKREGRPGAELGSALATTIFTGFDEALRQLGVSDFGLSRRIKAMANAFYGRLAAYESSASETALAEAILRNLYRGESGQAGNASLLAAYVARSRAALTTPAAASALMSGTLDFGPVPQA